MADNMKISFGFVDSSVIISNYFINYYIIARYRVSSMSKKNNTHINWVLFYVTQEVGHVFLKLGLKIVRTANDTAITSAMWNIAHASTKQNYIV